MLTIRIIEGHNKFRIGRVTKRGIKYRGRIFIPTGLRPLHAGPGDSGSAIAGAAAGAVLLGGVGLVAGSLIGGRGRTDFIITIADGLELVASVPSSEYAELYVEIERLKLLPPPQVAEARKQQPVRAAYRLPSWAMVWRLIAGPFYFARFGPLWLIGALVFAILTRGFGWLVLPIVAGHLDKRRAEAARIDAKLLIET